MGKRTVRERVYGSWPKVTLGDRSGNVPKAGNKREVAAPPKYCFNV
jgi:hypothetical protein